VEEPAKREKRKEAGRVDEEAAERILDELMDKYTQDMRRPPMQWTCNVREAAARRWQSLDDDKTDEVYQKMLREKSQAGRSWYEIKDLLYKDALAAVAGYGVCSTAGSVKHGKKCTTVARKLAKLEPSHCADGRMIDKLMAEADGLFPWNAELRKAMTNMEDKLLETT